MFQLSKVFGFPLPFPLPLPLATRRRLWHPRTRQSMLRPLLMLGISLPLVFFAPFAVADEAAMAEALFDRGLVEMKTSHYDVACPAFAESQRLDPRPGTIFTLAECERFWGKIGSALAHYAEYLRATEAMNAQQRPKHADRIVIAETQRKKLEPEVPKLTIRLTPDAPADTRVLRDGVELGQASLNIALPIDPGEHVFLTKIPGVEPKESRVTIAVSENRTLILEAPKRPLEAIPPPTPTPPPIPNSPTAPPRLPADGITPARDVPGVVWGLGAFGVISLGVGAAFAVDVTAVRQDVLRDCGDGNCQQVGQAASYQERWSRSLGLAVGLGALGVAGIGTSLVLLARDRGRPSQNKTLGTRLEGSAWVAPGAGGMFLMGRF